jgi:hypothetical protein
MCSSKQKNENGKSSKKVPSYYSMIFMIIIIIGSAIKKRNKAIIGTSRKIIKNYKESRCDDYDAGRFCIHMFVQHYCTK